MVVLNRFFAREVLLVLRINPFPAVCEELIQLAFLVSGLDHLFGLLIDYLFDVRSL